MLNPTKIVVRRQSAQKDKTGHRPAVFVRIGFGFSVFLGSSFSSRSHKSIPAATSTAGIAKTGRNSALSSIGFILAGLSASELVCFSAKISKAAFVLAGLSASEQRQELLAPILAAHVV